MINKLSLGFTLILSLQVYSQSKLQVEELSKPELVISNLMRGTIVLKELAHPNFVYLEGDQFQVFGPDNSTDIITFHCFGQGCSQETFEEGELEIVTPTGSLGEFSQRIDKQRIDKPIGLRVDGIVKEGVYVISVIRENKVHHKRTFRVVGNQPKIRKITVVYKDGSTSDNELEIRGNTPFSDLELIIDGTDIDQKFESVTLQGRKLRKKNGSPNVYLFGKSWRPDSLTSLEIGTTQVVIKRSFSSALSTKSIDFVPSPPSFVAQSLDIPGGAKDNKLAVDFEIANLYPDAFYEVQAHPNHPDFLKTSGNVGTSIDMKTSKASSVIFFDPQELKASAKFLIKIKNKDNLGESAFREVRVSKKAETVEMKPAEGNLPFVKGIDNQIRFTNVGGAAFPDLETGQFTLIFLSGDTLSISASRETDITLLSSFKLPDNLSEESRFSLSIDTLSWNGVLKGVIDKPVINNPSNSVFRGSSVFVTVQSANETRFTLESPNENIAIVPSDTKPDKTFEIKVAEAFREDNFSVLVKLKDHLLTKMDYGVLSYPDPRNLRISSRQKKRGVIAINEGSSVDLSISTDGLDQSTRFLAQIFKQDGTALGKKKEFKISDDGQFLKATLDPDVGLSPGDEFDILVSNPIEDTETLDGYIYRPGIENWIITTGISALDVPFTKDEADENATSTNILDGINFGVYYMLENVRNPQNRAFGIGANVLLSEENNAIKNRYAISTLWFEKLVFGMCFGEGGAGFMLGANIELADFSVFGGE